MARDQLPGPAVAAVAGPFERVRRYLLHTWAGRILFAALIVWLLEKAGLRLPVVASLAGLLLFLYSVYGGYRLFRLVLRRLLWKIRTKLILSYLFIAVVPVVLLAAFFLLAGMLFTGLVASHLVSAEIERRAADLKAIARTALSRLSYEDPDLAATLEDRLAPARAIHPQLSYALVRQGRVLASAGTVPHALPSWWKGPGFAGLVKEGERDTLRALWQEKDAFLILETPLDARLLSDLEKRTGIHLLTAGGSVQARRHGLRIDVKDEERERAGREPRRFEGMAFFATPERADWETGKQELEPLTFQYQPYELLRRLSPASLNTADILVKLLAIVGVIFLVMYAVALLLGFLLARSVTTSVHALSVGTEHMRQGDFAHRIAVRSRDQLGELAESFNVMARSVQDLLREQVEKDRLEEELRIARQIQMSLLPPQGLVTLPGLRIAALCLPAAEVGGDYYDLLPLSETRMGVLVADVSGKGTSAALYMAELKGLVLSLSRIYESPAKLLTEANRILAANMDSRSFITMTYAIVDTAARTMRYARAGHNPLIHLQAGSGRTRILTPQGLGLGIDRGDRFEQILEEAEVPLVRGDVFLFFTDGLSEAMNDQAELFGEGRLRQIIEGSEGLGSEEIKERILAEIRSFVGGAAQHDDMTLVILKVA